MAEGEEQQQQQQQHPAATPTPAMGADSSPSAQPATATVAAAREHEIEEVMQFLRFSVKPSSTFDGTILFRFKGDGDEPALTYAVEVAEDRGARVFLPSAAWRARLAAHFLFFFLLTMQS